MIISISSKRPLRNCGATQRRIKFMSVQWDQRRFYRNPMWILSSFQIRIAWYSFLSSSIAPIRKSLLSVNCLTQFVVQRYSSFSSIKREHVFTKKVRPILYLYELHRKQCFIMVKTYDRAYKVLIPCSFRNYVLQRLACSTQTGAYWTSNMYHEWTNLKCSIIFL